MHTSHGTIISVGGGPSGGMLEATGSILLDEMTTIAITAMNGVPTEAGPLVALELAGKVFGTNEQDSVNAVFLLSILDAGRIAGHLHEAVVRTGNAAALRDFVVGVQTGTVEVRER